MQSSEQNQHRPAWHTLTVEETARIIGTDTQCGLTTAEAGERLEKWGPNEIRPAPPISPFKLLLEQFTDFIVIVLIAAAIVSGILAIYSGHLQDLINPLAIVAIVILNAVLGFFQEYRAERALAALKRLTAPTARLLRDDKSQVVPAADLVPGDVLELNSGDVVPADARLIRAVRLRLDEAALTGESEAVEKSARAEVPEDAPLDARFTMVHAGTIVVHGHGLAIVTATGMETELGKIARLVSEIKEELTPLQQRLNRVGRLLVYVSLGIVAIIFPIGLARGQNPVDMFLIAVSLAVAAVPEGLAAVVTIALALGVRRMIRRNVLIRRLPAVETLGAASVICTDKTGTLTESEMTVRELALPDRLITVTGEGFTRYGEFLDDSKVISPVDDYGIRIALTIGALCNSSRLTEDGDGQFQVVGDPTEGALLVAAEKAKLSREVLAAEARFITELPFDPLRKRMTSIYAQRQEGAMLGAEPLYAMVKGAPEGVIPLCTRLLLSNGTRPLESKMQAAILETNSQLAQQARRVLALAYRRLDRVGRDASPSEIEHDLTFAGLAAIMDPPRRGAKAAVAKARQAGIRVIMITGDQPATAAAVARELGIASENDHVVTGRELSALTDEELVARVPFIKVYARVSPEDKLRIVRAWKGEDHNVVAMTGDGINDAPALKEAAIGIAMGVQGTDVAKEAADIILTDDNFASIVAAVEEGRSIYDNIRKFIYYLLSGNIGEVFTVFLGPLLGTPLPLLPIQILWMNLTTDSLPALALGVDNPEPNVMNHPPRGRDEPIIGRRDGLILLLQGLFIGLVQFTGFWIEYFVFSSRDIELARSVTLYLCILTQNLHAFNVRSRRYSIFKLGVFSNPWLVISFVTVIAITLLTAYVPVFHTILQTEPIGAREWLLIGGLAVLPVVAMEIVKAVVSWNEGKSTIGNA